MATDFEYQCQSEACQQKLISGERLERPGHKPPCPRCGEGLLKFICRYPNGKSGTSPRMHDVECTRCGKAGDRLVEDGYPVEPCECGAAVQIVYTRMNNERSSEDANYPRYIHALGCEVRDAKHHQEVMDRLGVQRTTDNQFSDEARIRAYDDQVRKEEAEHATYVDRLENDPQFRGFRELRDKGHFEKDERKLAL